MPKTTWEEASVNSGQTLHLPVAVARRWGLVGKSGKIAFVFEGDRILVMPKEDLPAFFESRGPKRRSKKGRTG